MTNTRWFIYTQWLNVERGFCRHVVDIENNYFEKNGLIEDMIEEMMIGFEDNDSNDDFVDQDDMIDKNDR